MYFNKAALFILQGDVTGHLPGAEPRAGEAADPDAAPTLGGHLLWLASDGPGKGRKYLVTRGSHQGSALGVRGRRTPSN